MAKMTSKPYSRSNNGVRLPFAYLILQNDGTYSFYIDGNPNRVSFPIPNKYQVLESCKPTSKKAPTIYIIFRNPIQKCLRHLDLKFERKDVSKISSNLWHRIDSNLRKRFETLYHDTIEEWKKRRLIFEFFTPLIEPSSVHEQTNSLDSISLNPDSPDSNSSNASSPDSNNSPDSNSSNASSPDSNNSPDSNSSNPSSPDSNNSPDSNSSNPSSPDSNNSPDFDSSNPSSPDSNNSPDSNSPDSVSNSPVELKPKLSYREEQRVIGELFFGWVYIPVIPDYNKYLERP
ncbi:hypothetical protein RclHR1_00070005 [Rhizophagus clarus]|uniref:TBC1 domain family member 30 n=1 Tax=Rhizophagus clarus TaxID=94130 RepID=A0A2Z6RU70_9GLOM|nr:hypothetical protein RclHR1_00070005 [Rhizophagus clarus]GES78179.1 TBC1 domain family member 30 [Rhizophagus clarus]